MNNQIPHLHLFMMCASPNKQAFRDVPAGYHIRTCKPSELDTWKTLSVEDPAYFDFMTDYFNHVYAHKADTFFASCLFACDQNDMPVGSCFVWKAYDKINTIHWFRVLPAHEGKGIGRALLSHAMKDLKDDEYPVYIHTHPTGFKAIKLYSDFGFQFVSNHPIGYRPNDLRESLPYLEQNMPKEYFEKLKITKALPSLHDAALTSEHEEF